jgi:hypothetical protein
LKKGALDAEHVLRGGAFHVSKAFEVGFEAYS